jgi:flagellar basal-body rod protein FlgF
VVDADGAVGKLAVVDFEKPEELRKIGGSLYINTGQNNKDTPATAFTIQQGYLEKSNVNPSEEMIKMIEAYRNFESVQKAIQSMDEITSKLVNDSELI